MYLHTSFAVARRLVLAFLGLNLFLSSGKPALAQSFGDAFSSQVIMAGAHCSCQPVYVDVKERLAMRDFIEKTVKKVKLRWCPMGISGMENYPRIIAVFEDDRWSIKRFDDDEPSSSTKAASRLVLDVLSHSRPPVQKSFAIVFTLDPLVEDVVEKTVEGTILTGGLTRWRPFEGVPVLSSQRDVDFGPYMADLQRKVKREWIPPAISKGGRAQCQFKILSDGRIEQLRLLDGSISEGLSEAALKAVRKAAPFRQLPDGAPPDVDIQFTFDFQVSIHNCQSGDPVYYVLLSCPEATTTRRANLHGPAQQILRAWFETERSFAIEKRQEFDRSN